MNTIRYGEFAATHARVCGKSRERAMKRFQPRGMPLNWCQPHASLANLPLRAVTLHNLQTFLLQSVGPALGNVKLCTVELSKHIKMRL